MAWRSRWTIHLVLALAAVLVAGLAATATAGAGGWAVTTLDEVPSAEPGVPVEVGFTIRQHGVTPVDLDDVAIEITGPAGTTKRFPAVGTGTEGHYVSEVTFPVAGEYEWAVNQSFFSTQPLGRITVGAPLADGYRLGPAWRFGLSGVAIGAAAWLLVDLAGARRRRAAVT